MFLERFPRLLSCAQEGIWIAQSLDPESTRFNVVTAFALDGAPGRAAVADALRAVAERHATLRTVFAAWRGDPGQLIGNTVVDLDEQDLPEDGVAAAMAAAAAMPFDLSAAPPWRAHLLHAGPADILVIVAHHLIADDRSMDIWAAEVRTLLSGGKPPELPVQYADFAEWERSWLDKPEQAGLLRYWRETLSGFPRFAGPAPDLRGGGGARFAVRSFPLDAARVARLRELARAGGATALVAWATVVGAALGERVPLGYVTEGRTMPEVERLIGCFTNIVALPVRTDGDAGFTTALARVRQAMLDGVRHAEAPFSRVVKELEPPRDGRRAPLVQAGVYAAGAGGGAGPGERVTSPFDLEFQLDADDQEPTGRLVYRADLYSERCAAELAGRVARLVERAARRPDQPLRARAPEAARRGPVRGRPAAEDPAGPTVDRLVREQAERTPEGVAVRFGARRLTYAALMARADAIAAALRGHGVRPGDHVGVLMSRSLDLVPAVTGVLAAGAVYVPLDPGYPELLLRSMAERGRLAVVVCDEDTARLGAGLGRPVLRASAPSGAAVTPARPAAAGASPVAYLMFTSGSTGAPKGVLVEHRSVVAVMRAMAARIGLTAGDRWLAVTPISFDISVLELLLPLTVGGTVIVAPGEVARDGARLAELVASSGATVLQATPATWRMLAAAGLEAPVDKALCGGEAMPPDLAGRLHRLARARWNLYGPTETTIWASAWPLPDDPGRPISIGRPLPSAEFLIDLADARDDGFGELLISGPCVARGYLDDPDTTAERFVHIDGVRHYRTGDLVRRLPDGGYEFGGRMDTQVKVRGFRIELVAVEAALRAHPEVADAVCSAARDQSGEHHLVAHIVAAAGRRPEPARLAAFLAERLPPHMVPSSWRALEAIPLTPSGKVDRAGLGSGAPLAGPGGAEPAPLTETERIVAGLCGRLLGVERLGPGDNVFTLGGHSLLMVQLQARIRDALAVAVPLRALFDGPTVREIARAVEERSGAARPVMPKLVRLPR